MNTLFETLDALDHTLYSANYEIAPSGNRAHNAESCPRIGDFIKARCPHPVLIRYIYEETGLVQGYRAGPLCILRLKPDSEQAIEIWLDIDEELEAAIPQDVLEPYRALRHTLDAKEHDNTIDFEFEIPQALIDNLTPCPLVARTGTLRTLTRTTGAPVTDELKLALLVSWSQGNWRARFKELVKAAHATRTTAFATRKPGLKEAYARQTPTAGSSKSTAYKQVCSTSKIHGEGKLQSA